MPLTSKGNKIMSAMQSEYGSEKGKRVFYASANKGTIKGVHQHGGGVPYVERLAFSRMPKASPTLVNSAVPGRTDKHPVNVPGGSYVLPADFVSSHGQNNTQAGAAKIKKWFEPGGRWGPRFMRPKFAGGGGVEGVPIIVAGGEIILLPHHVKRVGGGDLDKGFEKLDAEVLQERKRHIKTLRKLSPPKKK